MKIAGLWKASFVAACMAVSTGWAAAYDTSVDTISFKNSAVNVTAAKGTTGLSIKAGDIKTPGASYRADYQTYWITQTGSAGVEITFDATAPTMVQMSMRVAYVINSGASVDHSVLQVNINKKDLTPVVINNDQWHQLVVELPIEHVIRGKNVVKLSLADPSAPLFVQRAQLMPRNIYASDGVLDTTIFGQFGATSQVTGAKSADASGNEGTTVFPTIWTRAYGLEETTEMIPGPTFFYKAGDLLKVNLVNKLNTKAFTDNRNQDLIDFEDSEAANLGPNQDETLANLSDQVRQEVNIPHNLNNTNLHVHGLHVDPEKDDVTIVIIPDEEPSRTVEQYDAPSQLPTTPEALMCDIDEGSVSDQSVKPGNWPYVYRLPPNHLPGTHWFHPHKHGSTAAQLENGMAGSMVIEEPREQAIFPDHLDSDWSRRYDRVMMIQQIANYGLQQGTGNKKKVGGGQNQTSKPGPGKFTPDTVINGKHQPKYTLPPEQIVRWRFVNAGANHQAFNHMWLGQDTKQTVEVTNASGVKEKRKIYKSITMNAVAFDGITTPAAVPVTAQTPLLLAPGNRTDVLITAPKSGEGDYVLFKYYPSDIAVVDPRFATQPDISTDQLSFYCTDKSNSSSCTNGIDAVQLTAAFQANSNPYLFTPNNNNKQSTPAKNNGSTPGSGSYTENFAGFNVDWINLSYTGKKGSSPFNSTPVAPLIKLSEVTSGARIGFVDIDFALASEFTTDTQSCKQNGGECTGALGKWVPSHDGFGGGGVVPEKLLTISADPTKQKIGPNKIPDDTYFSSIAVAGTFDKGRKAHGFKHEIPAYVNPFNDEDILQSRPVIFDKSGVAIQVTSTGDNPQSAKVNQFTLNGRPFALNDMIGNTTSVVNTRLAETVKLSELKRVDTPNSDSTSAPNSKECTKDEFTSCLDIEEDLAFESSGGTVWDNGVCKSESGDCTGKDPTDEVEYYWTNPGYFQSLQYQKKIQAFSYTADAKAVPDWQAISGLPTTAIRNPNNKYEKNGKIHGNVNGIPGLPVATTAEEWVFINNSDVGHPFHIHINPFFVLEVGQLSYQSFNGGTESEWVMQTIGLDDSHKTCEDLSHGPAPTETTLCRGTSDIPNFVNNWWDTVIVPPHGYVRMRYWMNVPDQTETKLPNGSYDVKVKDNDNKIGVWVYHCHILRHEDRGMMMPVITQQMSDTPHVVPTCKLKEVGGAHHGH